MKNRKNLLLGIALIAVVVGSVAATWAITKASTLEQAKQATRPPAKAKTISTRYLDAFFRRYVAALNSKKTDPIMSFYAPNAVSVMAWGNEMNGEQRAKYFSDCSHAFPQAVIEAKKVMIVPASATSGYITWEFGMKAGPQKAPFLGQYMKIPKALPGKYDQEGVSTGQVVSGDRASLDAIKELEDQIAVLDKEILSLDEKLASFSEDTPSGKGGPNAGIEGSSHASEKFALAQKKTALTEQRSTLDQQAINKAVSSMKFARQSSFQNMDAFLKKLQ
jgi:uncharacterized small protein (DUF1192 family)